MINPGGYAIKVNLHNIRDGTLLDDFNSRRCGCTRPAGAQAPTGGALLVYDEWRKARVALDYHVAIDGKLLLGVIPARA